MSVVIRMKRAGARRRPFFRVVVADSRSPRDGRYIEQLGYYDPLTSPATFRVNEERFAHWVRQGARPSTSVEVMMAKHAPAALRPAPREAAAPEAGEVLEAAPVAKKPRAAKKKAAPAKKAARKKAAPKTKGTEKKAKARAKAKARKSSSAAKPKASKKTKKS